MTPARVTEAWHEQGRKGGLLRGRTLGGTLRYAAAAACSILGLALLPAACADNQGRADEDRQRLQRFEQQVEQTRTLLKIPGVSAVIVRDQRVLWTKDDG